MSLPLDAHAHVQTDIAPRELDLLDAYVVAVTRTPDEFEAASGRDDATTVWGLGCHPGLARPQKQFDAVTFQRLMGRAAVVGEVGLDASSRVPLDAQTANLTTVLKMLEDTPLVASLHSAGATAPLIELLEQHAPPGILLHWWRGTPDETRRAVELGCYFSVNSRDLAKPAVVGVAPPDRILTETDHPAGDRGEPTPRRPGNVPKITAALAAAWDMTPEQATRQVWRNWRALVLSTNTIERLPEAFQRRSLQG